MSKEQLSLTSEQQEALTAVSYFFKSSTVGNHLTHLEEGLLSYLSSDLADDQLERDEAIAHYRALKSLLLNFQLVEDTFSIEDNSDDIIMKMGKPQGDA